MVGALMVATEAAGVLGGGTMAPMMPACNPPGRPSTTKAVTVVTMAVITPPGPLGPAQAVLSMTGQGPMAGEEEKEGGRCLMLGGRAVTAGGSGRTGVAHTTGWSHPPQPVGMITGGAMWGLGLGGLTSTEITSGNNSTSAALFAALTWHDPHCCV